MKFTVSLKENRQFRRLYSKGRSEVSPFLALYYRRTGQRESRLGITVSGKLGKAVKRNLLRRRLHEAYRRNEEKFQPGYDFVVVARTRAMHSTYAQLERSLLNMAKKAGLLKKDAPPAEARDSAPSAAKPAAPVPAAKPAEAKGGAS